MDNIIQSKHRMPWIKWQHPTTSCLQETHLKFKDTLDQSDRVEKGIPYKWYQKREGVAILLFPKIFSEQKI
jgi:hypothetical protein